MSCVEKEIQCNEEFPTEKPPKKTYNENYELQVFQCIAYIIHKCPILQELFLKWATLSNSERTILNFVVFHIFNKTDFVLYSAIIKGIDFWNHIQDTEGACGYHKNPLTFKFDGEDEKQIFQAILETGKLLNIFVTKLKVYEGIRKFDIGRLKSSIIKQGWGDK